MHLIIPYASSRSDGCTAVLPTLKLPNLQKLLARLSPQTRDSGDELSLSTPHERALAQALGMSAPDGQIAWAALEASRYPELKGAGQAWGFISLCHWNVNTHHVAMSHLPLPDLNAAESDALLAAMRPYFEEDGIALHGDQPGRWLAQGELLKGQDWPSPDRVVGRNLDRWMPSSTQAAPLRRLQNEMQMLLYTHPVNDAREARGVMPVNSFWLSGTGALPAGFQMPAASTQPTVINTLTHAALTEDWPAWSQAWTELDANHILSMRQAADRGEQIEITLCGERHAQTWHTQTPSVWHRVISHFGSKPPSSLLEKL